MAVHVRCGEETCLSGYMGYESDMGNSTKVIPIFWTDLALVVPKRYEARVRNVQSKYVAHVRFHLCKIYTYVAGMCCPTELVTFEPSVYINDS